METDDRVSTDALERELVELELLVSRIRARQCELINQLDTRRVTETDGARTLTDWLSARLDLATDTAKTLVGAARRLQTLPGLTQALTNGQASFDRIRILALYTQPSQETQTLTDSYRYDIPSLTRVAARHRRITRQHEQHTARTRYLVIQPDLFDCSWKLWGKLTATEGAIVETALTNRADTLPQPPNHPEPRPQRLATALVALCQDSPTPTTTSGLPQVTIFIDAHQAAQTGGETGATIATGPRVGPQTLEQILCTGMSRVRILAQFRGWSGLRVRGWSGIGRGVVASRSLRGVGSGCIRG